MIKLIITSLLLLFTIQIMACKPSWVKMMARENVNYFVAIERFDTYWAHHLKPKKDKLPAPDAPAVVDVDNRRFFAKIFQSQAKAQQKSNSLRVQYKNFNKWKDEMLPYVKSDGSIMTSDERIEAWKQLNSL